MEHTSSCLNHHQTKCKQIVHTLEREQKKNKCTYRFCNYRANSKPPWELLLSMSPLNNTAHELNHPVVYCSLYLYHHRYRRRRCQCLWSDLRQFRPHTFHPLIRSPQCDWVIGVVQRSGVVDVCASDLNWKCIRHVNEHYIRLPNMNIISVIFSQPNVKHFRTFAHNHSIAYKHTFRRYFVVRKRAEIGNQQITPYFE